MYNDEAVWQSLENGIKQGMNISIMAEGSSVDWLNYVMKHTRNQEVIERVKKIIIQIPDNLTYRIYQEAFLNKLNDQFIKTTN
jgi:hypothetical protein